MIYINLEMYNDRISKYPLCYIFLGAITDQILYLRCDCFEFYCIYRHFLMIIHYNSDNRIIFHTLNNTTFRNCAIIISISLRLERIKRVYIRKIYLIYRLKKFTSLYKMHVKTAVA